MRERLYTIKETSARTGLSTQLIRKWEERYGAVEPPRFPNGYRGYTRQDIETLMWLKTRVDTGVPIGMAVQERKMDESGPAPCDPPEGKAAETVDRNGLEESRGKLTESLLALDG